MVKDFIDQRFYRLLEPKTKQIIEKAEEIMKNEPQENPDVPVLFTPSANGGKGRAKPYRKTHIIEGKLRVAAEPRHPLIMFEQLF